MSLFAIYLSPRVDIITLMGFVFINSILFILLCVNEKRKNKEIENKINDILNLLHSLNCDADNYEIIDDDFGKLRDEIVKIIIENNRIANMAIKNEDVLREYTEDIAHQIKTPLTGALLLLDLMEENIENSSEYIKRLRNDIKRLHQLSEVLLKLATLDSGIISMNKERVDIKQLVEDIIFNMEVYFNNCDFRVNIYGDDFILICDKRWTYEAIFNIIKNGIEASKNNCINVSFKETNLYSSIIIEDFSAGLNSEMLKKAYRRFYKENPNSKGYGIGLPMAKSIIERQNGELIYTKGKNSNSFELRFYK